MLTIRSTTMILAAAAALTACGKEPDRQPAAGTLAETTGVTRDTVEATPTPAAAPTAAVIQTQPGPDGSQVALNKVAVVGDIMTVSLTYSGGTSSDYAPLDQVSVIDDATSQRISILKDNTGKWMAAPLFMSDQFQVDTSKRSVLWFKFPAPPASTKTISLTIPHVAPFDAVPVTR